jgi:hypothetical protein
MHYTYDFFWWPLLWFVPLALLLWGVFAWSPRRYGYRSRYGWVDDDYDDDSGWSARRHRVVRVHRGKGPRNYRRSDERIIEDVNDRLMMADDVDASNIETAAEAGRVSLNGSVTTRYEKRRAESLADSIAGVVDVDNHLTIGPASGRRELTLGEDSLHHSSGGGAAV